MEMIAHDYQTYVKKCKESSNVILKEAEYEVANEVVKGFQYKEISDILSKEFWCINNLKKAIYKRLGINNSVELVWYMWFINDKRKFDIEVIRKHGVELFFSVWFLFMAITPDYQMDMRRCRVRSSARTSVRTGRTRRECDSLYIV